MGIDNLDSPTPQADRDRSQGGNMIFDPNGWSPTEHDVLEVASGLEDVVLSDGTVTPMDETLIRYAAARMEHEGGVGEETFDRTREVYLGIVADARRAAEELASAFTDNDSSLDPEIALMQAQAEVDSELTERAARVLLERKGVIDVSEAQTA